MTKPIPFYLYVLRYLLFLVVCFFVSRFIFFLVNFNSFNEATVFEIILSFIHGCRIDASMSAYIVLFPFLFGTIGQLFLNPIVYKIISVFTIAICFILAVIGISNAVLYSEWNSILNNRALIYLKYPKEIIASLTLMQLIILPVVVISITLLNWWLYKKIIFNYHVKPFKNWWLFFLQPIIVFVLLAIIGRGGFQLTPINQSSVYFSNTTIVNHLAVNSTWHLAADLLADNRKNNYAFYTNDELNKHFSFFKCTTDSSIQIVNTKTPNILFVVLESFSSNACGYYGCKENLTPNFDRLSKQALTFDSIYSSGFRTEQGIINIFSGFPAQPDQSIITQPDKGEKLPSLFSEFKKQNYTTSFYYGGEIEFANIGAYLRQNKVDKIVTEKDFDSNQKNSKWGAHDEFIFKKAEQELVTLSQPFMATILTLSNHEPFEIPSSKNAKDNTEQNGFKRTVQYTDSCLGAFIRNCEKTEWYKNTLIILVADHGHRLPYNISMNYASAKHIPLMLLGGALKEEYKGISIKKIANQHDIPATIISQLPFQKSLTKFPFSHSILNPSCFEYAYFTNENVLGWKEKNSSFSFSFPDKKIYMDKGNYPDSATIQRAQSFLQKVYLDYLNY